jgi:carboxypeptidase Taq
MRPVLSPAEILGLSGAALEGRARSASHNVADAVFARLADRLRADAWSNQLIYEHEGVEEPVRIMLRPLLVMPEQLSYVHYVCLQLIEALKRLPTLYLLDERVRRIISITEGEESWFRNTWTSSHERSNSVYGRLDAVCDFAGAGWQDSLRFMEPNLTGVGGIHFSPVAEELIFRDVVPTLFANHPELIVSLPRDQRDLFVQLLIDHARTIGRDNCQLCFIDPKYIHEGPNEQSVLSSYLSQKHGLTIAHADPRELRVVDNEVYYEDTRIDVAYRDYTVLELIEYEQRMGTQLEAMRLLFQQNRIISSMVGEFDHKSAFEILTDSSLAERYFSSDDLRLFRRHILWTRLVGDRITTLPDRREGDLLRYARNNRELLVLKPNRSYGGTGVVMGAATEQSEWERQLEKAATLYGDPERSSVLQAAARLPVHEFPVMGADGRVFVEPFYAVMGFAATENGLGTMCRVSQKQVVNVAQRGGLAAVLEAEAPRELTIPTRPVNRAAASQSELRSQIRELRHLDHTIALLGWDEETMLPPMGREERGEQTATLEGLRHALLTSNSLGDLIEQVSADTTINEGWSRELQLLRRLRQQAVALPQDLVRNLAHSRSQCLAAWEEARDRNDFNIFARSFDELLGLLRDKAAALADGGDPYDALLGENEHGMTRTRLEPVLEETRTRLVPLVREASSATSSDAHLLQNRTFADAGQSKFCRNLLTSIGFEFDRGRMDRSTHPFTLYAGVNDVRVTIRVDENDLFSGTLATLHEGGHGLYDQGFDPADHDSLLGDAPSMGMHECQARLWENHIGRSRAFWRFAFPLLCDVFPEAVDGLDPDTMYRAVNVVRPSVNRVCADEMSYHLHIILRYELEIALLSGTLSARELPFAWNERSAALLGVAPSSDREGVLQDVHWALGAFGYFSSYTLGSIYAAQLVEAYSRGHPLEQEIERGEFHSLLQWLRTHVHRVGHRFDAEAIVSKATGSGLDTGAFFRHLQCKVLN